MDNKEVAECPVCTSVMGEITDDYHSFHFCVRCGTRIRKFPKAVSRLKRRQRERRMLMGNGIKTQHHIIPTSRGGDDDVGNIASVKKKLHDKYHSLFQNKTPEEIIDFIVNTFWKGRLIYLRKYLEEKDAEAREAKTMSCL